MDQEPARRRAAMDDPRPRISQPITGYRYPRTVADLIELRRAQLAEHGEEPPPCHTSEAHGPMVLRPFGQQTYEQLYTGINWDCQACRSSRCWLSRDLQYDHGEPYNTGHGFEKFTGQGWTPISDDEARAFWTDLAAWRRRQSITVYTTRPPAEKD